MVYSIHHYDCLVMPCTAVSLSLFPWDLVTLVLEYEPLAAPLFLSGDIPHNIHQYIVLNTVTELSNNQDNYSKGELVYAMVSTFYHLVDCEVPYSVIASGAVTDNGGLLCSLESKCVCVCVLERERNREREEYVCVCDCV